MDRDRGALEKFGARLEVVLWAFHDVDFQPVPPAEATWVEVHANEGDYGHIAAHIGVDLAAVSPWTTDYRTLPPPRWVVVRQDDNGVRVDVGAHTSQCAAGLVAAGMETTGHKQTYWVEKRDG